jgi:hypothetical protein
MKRLRVKLPSKRLDFGLSQLVLATDKALSGAYVLEGEEIVRTA